MAVRITDVEKGSLCARKRVHAGDVLLRINGHDVTDVLDYRFYVESEKLTLEVQTAKGRTRNAPTVKGFPISMYFFISSATFRVMQ